MLVKGFDCVVVFISFSMLHKASYRGLYFLDCALKSPHAVLPHVLLLVTSLANVPRAINQQKTG